MASFTRNVTGHPQLRGRSKILWNLVPQGRRSSAAAGAAGDPVKLVDKRAMKNQRMKHAEQARSNHSGSAAPNPPDLARLSHDADRLVTKLIRLRQHLAEMRRLMREAPPSSALSEANRHLMLAALDADTVAETAATTLGELARSSQHDALTDLPNRLLMFDRLEIAIASARRHDTRIAVLFIDLDSFKQINDTLGHPVGDEVLKLVARRLQGAVRDSDTVSRHGGEEFLVLLPDVSQAADAAVIAEKLLAAISAPCQVAGHRLELSASIGITVYPEDGEDAETLISRADDAMYRAKRMGPGRHEFYAEKLSLTRRGGEAPLPPA